MKRILVVGGGLIGARHVRSVVEHQDCALVGLADPDARVFSDHGHPRYADMREVSDHVDGVILATPTHLHGTQGEYAASRGWHMLIEKPVAADLPSAHRLSNAVTRSGVGSLVGHHRRYHAVVQQLKSIVESGMLGSVVSASLIWAMRKPDAYFEGNWRTTGGSPVMINIVHDIDLLRFVVGEISDCAALPGAGLRRSQRIEAGAVALSFENGATGTINFADTAPSPWGFEAATGENPNIGQTGQDMLWIAGTQGGISFPSMTHWKGSDWSRAAERQRLEAAQNKRTPLQAQLDHFVDVMDGARPMIDVADATRTLEITLEIERQLTSKQTGAPNARSAFA